MRPLVQRLTPLMQPAAGLSTRESALLAAWTCPRCGAPRGPASVYCIECGLRLPERRGAVASLRRRWVRRIGWYPGDWVWLPLLGPSPGGGGRRRRDRRQQGSERRAARARRDGRAPRVADGATDPVEGERAARLARPQQRLDGRPLLLSRAAGPPRSARDRRACRPGPSPPGRVARLEQLPESEPRLRRRVQRASTAARRRPGRPRTCPRRRVSERRIPLESPAEASPAFTRPKTFVTPGRNRVESPSGRGP